MTRTLWLYGLALAFGALLLTWIEYQHAVRLFSTEVYIVLIALLFTGLGIWTGQKLTPAERSTSFKKNDKAISELGITRREYEVLQKLAAGSSNKEIAEAMGVSPNTVKSQISSLYTKLNSKRRTDAIGKARKLGLIP